MFEAHIIWIRSVIFIRVKHNTIIINAVGSFRAYILSKGTWGSFLYIDVINGVIKCRTLAKTRTKELKEDVTQFIFNEPIGS